MVTVSRLKLAGFLGVCMASVCALSLSAGSASARVLLFLYSKAGNAHFVGSGGAQKFETLSGKAINTTATDALLLFLSPTLFDLHLEYLHFTAEAGAAECSNTGNATTVLVNLLGHLGLADPGDVPAVLLLVPAGFEFTCSALGGIIKEHVLMRGGLIGRITKPEILKSGQTLLEIEFKLASRGVQAFSEFLLGNTLIKEMEQFAIGGAAFELAGQEGTLLFHILEGTFELEDHA
jgi:hypothetical protein